MDRSVRVLLGSCAALVGVILLPQARIASVDAADGSPQEPSATWLRVDVAKTHEEYWVNLDRVPNVYFSKEAGGEVASFGSAGRTSDPVQLKLIHTYLRQHQLR